MKNKRFHYYFSLNSPIVLFQPWKEHPGYNKSEIRVWICGSRWNTWFSVFFWDISHNLHHKLVLRLDFLTLSSGLHYVKSTKFLGRHRSILMIYGIKVIWEIPGVPNSLWYDSCYTVLWKVGIDFQSDEAITKKARLRTWISNFEYIQRKSKNILSKQWVWTVIVSESESFLGIASSYPSESTNKNAW